MYHCTATRRPIRYGSSTALALFGAVLFGTVMMLAGCQSPATPGALRIPGTPHLPGIPQVPTPKLTPGGKTPAVPGVEATSAITPQNEIAQVGFVDALRGRAARNCGVCQGCSQGGPCVPDYSMMPMGRPVDPQEYLCNGGDLPPEARVLRDDSVGGLGPQDAVVHYTTEAGDMVLQPSNTVCLYSPRFGAIRQVSGAVAGEKAVGLSRTYQPIGPTGIGLNQPSLVVEDIRELGHADVTRRIDAMRDRNRGVPVEGIVQPLLAADVMQILATLDAISLTRLDESQIAVLKQGAIAAQSWMIRDAVEVMIESMHPPTLTRDARVEAFVEYDFPDAGRLQIVKVADKEHAQQGDEVTFAIHVKNVGDSAVREVEIADSLTGRLEYVQDSQQCDRETTFETQGNAAGSVRLKWSLSEPLAVGETATIEFKCRVR